MKVIIFIIGIVTDIFLLGIFWWLLSFAGYSIAHIQTVIFAALGLDSLLYVTSCRSLKHNIWHINPFSNKLLLGAIGIGMVLLLLGIYNPFLQKLLHTVPLNSFDWGIVTIKGILILVGIEITKWFFVARKKLRAN